MIDRPENLRPGLGIPLLLSLLTLAVYALTRIGLALWTGMAAVPFSLWPAMLAQGLWFDLAALTALLAPVLVYEAALPNRWRRSRLHHALRFGWLAVVLFALLFGAVAEATFWLEFATSASPTRCPGSSPGSRSAPSPLPACLEEIEAFHVDPATFESVRIPVDRTLADEAVAYYQTASRAFRQGALKEVVSAPRAVTARHPP